MTNDLICKNCGANLTRPKAGDGQPAAQGTDATASYSDRVVCPRCATCVVTPVTGDGQSSATANFSGSFDRHFSVGAEMQLPERFTSKEIVGQGSFGTVRRCWDEMLRREVAVKLPRKGGIRKDVFLREARMASKLRHQNIIRVFDIGEVDGNVFIVSEFIKGSTLSGWGHRESRSEDEIVIVLAKICRAIEYAHQHGVLHRDLKPGNIMVDGSNDEPFVLDFGLSRSLDHNEDSIAAGGAQIGTPAFMSPEQVNRDNEHVDARTDVYGLGVIMFQLLTGQLPYQGSLSEIFRGIIDDQSVPSSKSRRPSVSAVLNSICLKAMAKAPEDRYQTAGEMAADLERCLRGERVAAHNKIHARQAKQLTRRYGALTGLAAAVFVAAVAWWLVYRNHAAANPMMDVTLQTEPPDLPMTLQAYSQDTAFLNRDKVYRVRSGEPCQLPPGFYRVIVRNGELTRQVYRTVPVSKEAAMERRIQFHSQTVLLSHRSATFRDGYFVLPSMDVLPKKSLTEQVFHQPGEVSFTGQGADRIPVHLKGPPKKVPGFEIDTSEVTWAILANAWTKLVIPEGVNENEPAAGIPWDVAVAWCESNGCNLPSIPELVWAASNEGKTEFMQSDVPPSKFEWNIPDAIQDWDVTRSNPPVRGLLTGMNEWTEEPAELVRMTRSGEPAPLAQPSTGPITMMLFPEKAFAVLNQRDRIEQTPKVVNNLAFLPVLTSGDTATPIRPIGFRTVRRYHRFPGENP